MTCKSHLVVNQLTANRLQKLYPAKRCKWIRQITCNVQSSNLVKGRKGLVVRYKAESSVVHLLSSTSNARQRKGEDA